MPALRSEIRQGAYYDSVVLMQLQRGLLTLPGVLDAGAVMATPVNLELLEASGLRPAEAPSSDDLLIVVRAETDVAAGEALFVAKGCVMCHVHAAVSELRELSLEVGPELTSYRNAPEFLRLWLSNPAGVRPKTGMPDLDLSGEEIEALIGFLNQEA